MQFVNAQTGENEIIKNALETVEKATTEGLSKITESVNNASESITTSTEDAKELSNNTASSQAFQQIKNIATDMGNATENSTENLLDSSELFNSRTNDNQYEGSSTLEEQLNLAQEKLKQSGLGFFTDSGSKSLDKQGQSVQEKINQTYQVENTGNWIIGESDKLNFMYPNNWNVNVSDSRFDNYELLFQDQASNSSIRVSDEAISTTNKILHGNNPERYFDSYMMQNLSLSSDASKIETYPKGKVSIAGLPAYSELYLDKGNAILISLAFQEGNERHYTVFSKSPSSQYDSLEPRMLEIIKSITPKTIQKPSDVQFEISSNNTDADASMNNQSTEQQKKKDLLETGSLLSNITKSNNLNKSLIIKQQQENGSLTQSSHIYEGLGVKINYSDPWKIITKMDDPSCFLCSTFLSTPDLEAKIMIIQDKFADPKIKNNCKCNTLLDYVKYVYEDTISKNDDLIFINDNQTTLKDSNIPAIQMEYEKKDSTISGEILIYIFTKGSNSFYSILFSTDKNQQYSKYLNDFKKMVNSLKFVSTNETKKKIPSFMMDRNESINTSPILNLTNDNALDLSNNEKQELSESIDSNKNHKIDIPSYNSYINSIGHLHVIGEVENNSPIIAEFVKIIGTFYDDSGTVVGTSSTYADPNDIDPGEKAPFDLILSDSTIPVDQIKKYQLTISYR